MRTYVRRRHTASIPNCLFTVPQTRGSQCLRPAQLLCDSSWGSSLPTPTDPALSPGPLKLARKAPCSSTHELFLG